MRAKVTLRFLQKCKIATHWVSEFLMQNEAENNWASVNTKHAIEESPSRTWHRWRQVFTVNSVTTCNDTDAVRAANAWVWLPAMSVNLCTQVGLVWQECLVCYTVNLYVCQLICQLTHWYTPCCGLKGIMLSPTSHVQSLLNCLII